MRKGTHPRTALGQTAAQMIRRYYLHDVARDSAALTYYLLFAIFPLLIFVSTLLGILELDVDSIVTGLRQIVPGDVAEVVRLSGIRFRQRQPPAHVVQSGVFHLVPHAGHRLPAALTAQGLR